MTRISWDGVGNRLFSTGVDRGVLYLQNGSGVPWNGLVSVVESPADGDVIEKHYDGVKYYSQRGSENFAGTIEAYTYPSEFELYEGRSSIHTSQTRQSFHFSYRSLLGNDLDGTDHGYLLHLVYNARVQPTESAYSSMNDSADIATFSWEFTTRPFRVEEAAGSHLIVNSTTAHPWVLQELEDILYGTDELPARVPTPEEILSVFQDGSLLKITDNRDGTWTADGPAEAIIMLDATTFQITWPSAVYLDSDTYRISSL